MADLWKLIRGDSPVIVNVPHAGIELPAEWSTRITDAARRMPDTDWHVEKLYRFAPLVEATLMWATYSRIVVDLNRDPSGVALYPGASNTEVCPASTFHDEPIYREGMAPGTTEIAERVAQYWQPYHVQLSAEIERIKARHGYCILLDAHSIVSEAPRFFSGRLPDLNLGTADGSSCDPALADAAFAVLTGARGFTAVHNGRFKGGYITRHHGRPVEGMHALQLEMAQSCYMDENHPAEYHPDRAAPLLNVLQMLIQTLLAWRPELGEPPKK
ncbi:MAG: N-formylglutamate deformylase [Betaproteobacteria bacterium]|nr:N-formylglutamate deformylase [Betaproteobacteria bacterium]